LSSLGGFGKVCGSDEEAMPWYNIGCDGGRLNGHYVDDMRKVEFFASCTVFLFAANTMSSHQQFELSEHVVVIDAYDTYA
jgi:hypothetical protein